MKPNSWTRPPLWTNRQIAARQWANRLNLSTALGRFLAWRAGVRPEPGPHGVQLVFGYQSRIIGHGASAITLGDVVLLRIDRDHVRQHPQLLDHEARHSMQYALWIGPLGFIPAYACSTLWSMYRCGDRSSHNHFERRAVLHDGGYKPRPPVRPKRWANRDRQQAH